MSICDNHGIWDDEKFLKLLRTFRVLAMPTRGVDAQCKMGLRTRSLSM